MLTIPYYLVYRLEIYNLVRHVAVVANGLLRMCVDASVEKHSPALQASAKDMASHAETRCRHLKGSISLTHQFNLSEDHSLHITLGKAYLRCRTRVVEKVSARC